LLPGKHSKKNTNAHVVALSVNHWLLALRRVSEKRNRADLTPLIAILLQLGFLDDIMCPTAFSATVHRLPHLRGHLLPHLLDLLLSQLALLAFIGHHLIARAAVFRSLSA
jgi:hypothetical protein